MSEYTFRSSRFWPANTSGINSGAVHCTNFSKNILTIKFRESFKPRRGRINCSLNDNGKWRWLGVQFTVRPD